MKPEMIIFQCKQLQSIKINKIQEKSAWILNGSSIECHEKKHQRFSLSGVRFGSRVIQISGAVEN